MVQVSHATLRRGDGCPCCHKGRLYDSGKPGIDYRFRGQPTVVLTIYKEETLRCNLCGEISGAEPPPEAGAERYDATVGGRALKQGCSSAAWLRACKVGFPPTRRAGS